MADLKSNLYIILYSLIYYIFYAGSRLVVFPLREAKRQGRLAVAPVAGLGIAHWVLIIMCLLWEPYFVTLFNLDLMFYVDLRKFTSILNRLT